MNIKIGIGNLFEQFYCSFGISCSFQLSWDETCVFILLHEN